jgi:murein DD-endopeptidase MepM/ murein hydrolase activator NlpD
LEPIETWAQRATDFHRLHRRAVNAAVVSTLAGFSAVAFGIAPLAPDAADLPQRLVVEDVVPEGIEAQLDALAAQELELTRADLTRSSDSAQTLLARLGVVDDGAAAFLRGDPTARRLLQGRPGKMVQVQTGEAGRVVRLVARYPAERSEQSGTHFTRLTIERSDARWSAKVETAALESQVRLGSGTIRSSLFAATDEARIPDGVSSQLADIFSAEIDFRRDLQKGDNFSIVYEALTADGEPITWNEGAGRVLAAEFVNEGKKHEAVWFATGGGRGGYFALDGTSKQRLFLGSPMVFSRVTSGFAMRVHPILGTLRAHKGVDYGAPIGTAIRTVGAGVVTFAGWQNGYGKAVEIQHGNGRNTFYAHMSRLDVRPGQRVDQGQTVGAVGMTGLSTGPHLHFEFRVDGVHQDPLRIARASESVALAPALKPVFTQQTQTYKVKLALAESMRGTRIEAE